MLRCSGTLVILLLSVGKWCSALTDSAITEKVEVFHLINNALWGEVDGSALQGQFNCPKHGLQDISCVFYSSDQSKDFLNVLTMKLQKSNSIIARKALQVSLYNIHTWGTLSIFPHYPSCQLPTDLTMAESEESHRRFKKLFKGSFPLYDGNSTTSPYSSVQRSYIPKLNVSMFLPLRPFSESINGASFVASTCHRGGGTTNREGVVAELGKTVRVDSLGKCMKTNRKDSAVLKFGVTAAETLSLKQQALSKYLFYLAFENTEEAGYVTEKVMDALIAGTVPVYLGDTEGCRKLLPHPNAAIFVDDFHSVSELADYLTYLTHNETAYEEHRAWRNTFDPEKQHSLLQMSWPCSVCHWALTTRDERISTKYTPKKVHCV